MQMRSKTYLHLMSLWRVLRRPASPHAYSAPARTSPSLLYTAVILALLLAILEIEQHRAALDSIGVVGNHFFVEPVFMGP